MTLTKSKAIVLGRSTGKNRCDSARAEPPAERLVGTLRSKLRSAKGGGFMKRPLLICWSTLTVMLLAAIPSIASAQPQAFPTKPVRIVIPYPPAGSNDTLGRAVSHRLSEIWRQPVVVENRPGGGTTLGTEYVARAAPDGYTLLFSDSTVYVISPHLYSKLSYNVLTDFAPITVLFHSSLVLAMSNAVPAKTFGEFLAYVRANPGKLSYGSWGYGSIPHVAIEKLKQMARIDLLHVPYKGGSQALTDMIAGRVALLLGNYAFWEAHEKAGKLKIIVAVTEKRLAVRPDLPTATEADVPGYVMDNWYALVAPAGTPVPVLDRIHADALKVVRDPGFAEKFLKPQTLEVAGNSREEFAAMLKAEYAYWGQLVRESGAKVE